MIGHLDALDVRTLIAQRSGERLSDVRSLSDYSGLKTLLVHHETLLPQSRSATPHYHTLKEELFFVLSGRPSVWLNGILHDLKPGDFVGCPPDASKPHTMVNLSDEVAVILTIGTNPEGDVTTFVDE